MCAVPPTSPGIRPIPHRAGASGGRAPPEPGTAVKEPFRPLRGGPNGPWALRDQEKSTDPVAVLGRLFVLHEARGHALGERLVRTARDHAHEHGRRLVLDVMTKDTAAIRLYERLGWQRIGTTQHTYGHGRAIDAYCYVSPS